MTDEASTKSDTMKGRIAANAQDSEQYFQLLTNHIADQVYEKVDKQNTRSRNRFAVLASSITALVILLLSSGAGMLIDFLNESAKITSQRTAEEEIPKFLEGSSNKIFSGLLAQASKDLGDQQRIFMDVFTVRALTEALDKAKDFRNDDVKEINRLILGLAENNSYMEHTSFPEVLRKTVKSYLEADRLDFVFEFEEKFRNVMLDRQEISDLMVDALGRDLAAQPAGIIERMSDSHERTRWLEKREIYRQYAEALGTKHRMPQNPYIYDILIACEEGGNDADIEMLVRKALGFSSEQLEGLAFMGEFIGGYIGARYEVAKQEWRDCLERGLEYDTKDNALGSALARFVSAAFVEIPVDNQQ